MKLSTLAAGSALVAALAFASPAAAQTTGVDEDGNGSADNNTIAAGSFNDLLDLLSNNANGDNRDNTSGSNLYSIVGSNLITANQSLIAVNTNQYLDEVVDLDGQDDDDIAPVGYNSGNNYVRGNAFAAFAGINSFAMNTGINNNVQSGVNLAAQGTVNFGPVNGSAPADGGADGD